MKRTTILIDEGLLLEALHLARRQGTTFTAVVHEALREYLTVHRAPRHLSFLGIGHSGRPDLAKHDEEILAAEADAVSGWSPRRPESSSTNGHTSTCSRSPGQAQRAG
jgi:hypothetical protein